ncbi:hypothetical protein FB451DRAFT_1193833 [Mycena latifolia]|nr:hypothetical protein FB451DRAFT_1193833 [Mycena latifolia]
MIEREVVWITQVQSPMEGFDTVPWGRFEKGIKRELKDLSCKGVRSKVLWSKSVPVSLLYLAPYLLWVVGNGSEFTGFPRDVGSVGDRGSHPGHGFDALLVGSPIWIFLRPEVAWCRNWVECGPPEELDARDRCRIRCKTKLRLEMYCKHVPKCSSGQQMNRMLKYAMQGPKVGSMPVRTLYPGYGPGLWGYPIETRVEAMSGDA